jgi:hypothetical protein
VPKGASLGAQGILAYRRYRAIGVSFGAATRLPEGYSQHARYGPYGEHAGQTGCGLNGHSAPRQSNTGAVTEET